MTPFRTSFDPALCTEWATFGQLEVGDLIDYWGAARPVVTWTLPAAGRVYIEVENANGGRDFALAPAEEGTYRVPRKGDTK